MAFSMSIRKGQIPLNCQICETGEKITWKCLDCSLLMCDRCKEKVHLEIKSAKDHRVINIKDVGKETKETLDFTNINCEEHAGQCYCLYCQTCDNLVCPVCVSKAHRKHDMVQISEAYDKKMEQLKIRQIATHSEQAKINLQKVRLKQLKSAENSKYDKQDEDILQHGIALKIAVDHYIERIRKELQGNKISVLQSINSDLNSIERASQQCDDHNCKIDELINTTDVKSFFQEDVAIEKRSDRCFLPEIRLNYCSIPIFIPGKIAQSNVGLLQTTVRNLLKVEFSVVKQFQTDLPMVDKLCACSEDSLWITYNKSEVLHKVKHQGNSLQVLSSYNVDVHDMALTPNNDLLLATGKCCLQQLKNSTGTIQDSTYNIIPFKIICVHVNQDHKVMVAGINRQKGQVVIVMNKEGERQNVYEQDKNKQPLFRYPWGITSTRNDRMYIADFHPSDGHGRLVILNQEGDVQYYTGHREINKDKPFRPAGLTTTPMDNVIVVDVDTYFLCIFNNLGQLITHFNAREIGIQRPYSPGFTPTGQLLIGCSKAKSSTDKAKLYQVNLLGC